MRNKRRAKSLFLYLLFYGTANREEIINLFWPELDLHRARNHLRVCLSHLNSMLNLSDGYEFIHIDRAHVMLRGEIKCDALAYIKYLDEAYSLILSDKMDLAAARNALRISPKKLLSHIYDDWFLRIRETVELKHSTLCEKVASYLRNAGRVEEAMMYEKKSEEIIKDFE